MSYSIALLPGDGIGPEVVAAARSILEASGLDLHFREVACGYGCFLEHGSALPAASLEAVRVCNAALLGAVGSPIHRVEGYRSPVVQLRRELDLFACIRPVRTPPLPDARPGIDMLIVRENTEDLYIGREQRLGDRATAERLITRQASERITRWALANALQQPSSHHPRRITIVHKANVLRETCGLFREAALSVLQNASSATVDEMLVDNAAYQLVRKPEQFDIIVTTNMFGDILSDIASAWGGGLGLAVSANIGDEHAIFEPVHGSAPDIAGKGIANPLATIAAAAAMLRQLGEEHSASQIEHAINTVLRDHIWTPDLGGNATTEDVTRAVINSMRDAG